MTPKGGTSLPAAHSISFSEGSGRLDTRLDTPPSIKRRHPDSRIAPAHLADGQRVLARLAEARKEENRLLREALGIDLAKPAIERH